MKHLALRRQKSGVILIVYNIFGRTKVITIDTCFVIKNTFIRNRYIFSKHKTVLV